MTKENSTDNLDAKIETPPKPEIKKGSKPKLVTADRDVDFPALNWGISAGTERELPVEEESQTIILSNYHIKLVE